MTDLDTGASASGSDDLRSALESAWTEDSTPATTTALPVQKTETPAPVDSAATEAKHDRERNPDGTYKAKAEQPDAKPVSTGQAAPAPETVQQPATRKAPASWSKDVQAHWDKLDPAIQDQILKRESDVSKGFEERATKLKPYEELDRVFQPHRQRWQLNGWSEAQAVQQLLAAQDYLDRDPVAAIRWLAGSYRVPLEQLVQQPAASNQQADPLAQYLAPVFQELQQINGRIAAREQAEQNAFRQNLQTEIETFGNSKDHPHFEAVKPVMASLLKAEQAKGLQDAYDKAVWLDPDIRRQVLDEQARAQAGTNAAEVEKAKRAASSVTGAPTGGAPTRPNASLREELEAAFG